jgi:chromosome partitioning protein
MSSHVTAIANQKGGVGKTTTAINLGAALAARGRRVLIIDLDPQGNASTGLGIDRTARRFSTYDLLFGSAGATAQPQRTMVDDLSIIPADMDLASADSELMRSARRVVHLKHALTGLPETFDHILLDCPPALNLVTVNALVAARDVLVPLQAEFFALEGLSQLLLTIRDVRSSANADLRLAGVVLTMFDRRNRLCQDVEREARETLGDLVLDTKIPRNVRLSEAPSHSVPILNYEPTSRGAIAYRSLAGEFLERMVEEAAEYGG